MKQYIVDAFTDTIFKGNPAAICIMDAWLEESLMMSITKENNLSETAFAVKEKDKYHIRWFTPGGEVNLCGHATLATAYVLFNYYETSATQIVFTSMSGDLFVNRKDDLYEMDFPDFKLTQVPVTDLMAEAIGVRPIEAYLGRDLLCVLEHTNISTIAPNIDKVLELDGFLLHITQASSDYDCESRTFGPKTAIVEDPVCGSGHCHIVPYWSNRLNKQDLTCFQASTRTGILYCSYLGDRVIIRGKAALYAISELNI